MVSSENRQREYRSDIWALIDAISPADISAPQFILPFLSLPLPSLDPLTKLITNIDSDGYWSDNPYDAHQVAMRDYYGGTNGRAYYRSPSPDSTTRNRGPKKYVFN